MLAAMPPWVMVLSYLITQRGRGWMGVLVWNSEVVVFKLSSFVNSENTLGGLFSLLDGKLKPSDKRLVFLALVLSYLNNFIVTLIMLVLLSFSFSLEVLFISQIPGFYFIQAVFFFLKRQFLAIWEFGYFPNNWNLVANKRTVVYIYLKILWFSVQPHDFKGGDSWP